MTKLTIGHYASHKNTGGYTPPRTDGPKAQFPPKSGSIETSPINLLITDEDVVKAIGDIKPQPTDLELRNRKEILQLLNSFRSSLYNECECYSDYYGEGCGYSSGRLEAIEEISARLKEMWGE